VTAEQARREFDADVVWLPFDLHPEYPPEGIPLAELHRRYGIGVGEANPLRDRSAAAGLEYNRRRPSRTHGSRCASRSSRASAGCTGINAIPTFLLDRRLIVIGAQPLDVFRRAFAQLAA
jgi:predicted DsbA family dithiol-disulfide isomerase